MLLLDMCSCFDMRSSSNFVDYSAIQDRIEKNMAVPLHSYGSPEINAHPRPYSGPGILHQLTERDIQQILLRYVHTSTCTFLVLVILFPRK